MGRWAGTPTSGSAQVPGYTLSRPPGLQGHTGPTALRPRSELSHRRPIPVGVFLCATPFIRGDGRLGSPMRPAGRQARPRPLSDPPSGSPPPEVGAGADSGEAGVQGCRPVGARHMWRGRQLSWAKGGPFTTGVDPAAVAPGLDAEGPGVGGPRAGVAPPVLQARRRGSPPPRCWVTCIEALPGPGRG